MPKQAGSWTWKLLCAKLPHHGCDAISLPGRRAIPDKFLPSVLGQVFLSPLDVVLSERRVVQPDVFFVANANQGIIQNRIRGVPDLAVEIISPGSWKRDRVEKKALYEQVGLSEYWIIDPGSRSLEVFALVQGSISFMAAPRGPNWLSPGNAQDSKSRLASLWFDSVKRDLSRAG
jgi:hypothetical protein